MAADGGRKGGDTINPWSIALFRSLKLANPSSASEQAAYGKWLDQTSDREEGRRDRLHGAEGIIPTSIWLVLFLIAGVIFAFMLFFADSGEGAVSQAMLMGSATTVIVLTLVAINALDNPYRHGVGRIKPVAMERSLRILDERARRRGRARPASLRRPRRAGRVLMEDASQARLDRHFELAATVLLAMAAVATAWAAYQSARWHGEQAKAQSASIAARVESTRAANVANRQAQIDVALFTQWVDAYARDETELAAFYRKRFRAGVPAGVRGLGGDQAADEPRRPAVAVRHARSTSSRPPRRPTASRRRPPRSPSASGATSSGPTTTRSPSCCSPRRCSSPASAPGCLAHAADGRLGLGYALFLGSLIWIATFPVSLAV